MTTGSYESVNVPMKWAWNPEDIGGRRLILVQTKRIERVNWQCLADAIESLKEQDGVEKCRRTPNAEVHAITFVKTPTAEVLEAFNGHIKSVYSALCDEAELDTHELVFTLADNVRDVLAPGPSTKPLKLVELLKSVSKEQLEEIRKDGLRKAVEKLDAGIDAGNLTYKQAYELLHVVIVGE